MFLVPFRLSIHSFHLSCHETILIYFQIQFSNLHIYLRFQRCISQVVPRLALGFPGVPIVYSLIGTVPLPIGLSFAIDPLSPASITLLAPQSAPIRPQFRALIAPTLRTWPINWCALRSSDHNQLWYGHDQALFDYA